MNAFVAIGMFWYCYANDPWCTPERDPTGPPATETFKSVMQCEYKVALGGTFLETPPGLVFRHTCSKHKLEDGLEGGERL